MRYQAGETAKTAGWNKVVTDSDVVWFGCIDILVSSDLQQTINNKTISSSPAADVRSKQPDKLHWCNE